MEKSATRRIGINTVILFGRKIVTLFLAFYTSRLLLERLGIDDFGLYGLVGSVVALFSALRGIFSTSVQRFINIAKGQQDHEKVNRVFSLGLKIHIWIAIVFSITVEIGGLIILPTLNIPEGSSNAAMWVLQFSILTSAFTIMTVPYDALIIANEKFNVYSLLSIIESALKLLVVVALSLCTTNRVIYYAGLLFCISILIRFANSLYCRYAFKDESKYHNIKDYNLLKDMTAFAGWQFCGNTAYALTNAGINILINLFGGVIVNAARTIAYQVMNAVAQFISDINVSFQPRLMMLYSSGEMKKFWQLFYLNSKVAFSMGIIIGFPFILTAQGIIKIWLGEVPQYSVHFLKCIILYMIVRSVHGPIDLLFKSEGKLKRYQLTELCTMAINIPISWIALNIGAPYWSVFINMSVIEGINLIFILYLAKIQIGLIIKNYIKVLLVRIFIVCGILSVLFVTIYRYLDTNTLNDFIGTTVLIGGSLIVTLLLLYFIIFTKSERKKLQTIIKLKND